MLKVVGFNLSHSSQEMNSSSAILRLIAEYSSDVIALVRPDMTFSYISPSSFRLTGRHASEVVGHAVAEFVFGEDLAIIAEATRNVMNGTQNDTKVTVRVIKRDGSLVWVEVASRLVGQNAVGEPGDRAVIMRDASDRKALEDELRSMAMKDGLTGLANRRAFDEALLFEWARTVRDTAQLSLLLIDIDWFKTFNDAYGHQVGDDCLRSISVALQAAAHHPTDLVARYGGEELAIVLPDTDPVAAIIIAERARLAVERLAIPDGIRPKGVVTVSIGVATALARHGGSAKMPHALLSAADRALYAAKESGRNCCRKALILAEI